MSKIIIVDDLLLNLSILEAELKKCGHEVVACRNGKEALQAAQNAAPDLIISDILMPVMDGYELCKRLKSDSRLRSIPFVFYTSTYTDPRDKAYALTLGADQFVIKPARTELLEKTVSEVLEARRGAAVADAPEIKAGEEEALRGHNEVLFRKLQRKILQLEAEVAARAEAERKLEQAAKELEKKNLEMQDFLYLASKELRIPLIKIKGFSENINAYCTELLSLIKAGADGSGKIEELLSRKLPQALGYIISGAGEMDQMFGGLIRISAHWCTPPKPEPVDMNDLVGGILNSLAWQIIDAGAEVTCGELPACLADKTQLGQIFLGLIDNSVKYRDPGRRQQIKIYGNTSPSGAVSYSVSDTGKGLSEIEKRGKVWELFYRGDPGGPVPGEGIGLSIMKRIAERNGGRIKADGVPGGGTVFTVEMPGVKSGKPTAAV